jgi:cytoskeletal protein CcmA (bactofilin family)
MLRIGKNPTDQKDNESTSQKQESPDYSNSKTYAPYQSTAPAETKPATDSATTSASARAMTESETIARDIKEGTLSGFVGSGTLVTGEANFKAMMRVDGHLSGRVISSSGTLIVGANGKVDANIEVAVAIIHGTINGDIIATQRLELGRAAKVNGNIQTPSLMIEQGAVFEGSCKMIQMSAAKEKAVRKLPDEKPLDASSIKTVNTDTSAKPKPTEIPVAGIVS